MVEGGYQKRPRKFRRLLWTAPYGSPKEHAYELPLRSLAINVKFILVGDPSNKIYLSFLSMLMHEVCTTPAAIIFMICTDLHFKEN